MLATFRRGGLERVALRRFIIISSLFANGRAFKRRASIPGTLTASVAKTMRATTRLGNVRPTRCSLRRPASRPQADKFRSAHRPARPKVLQRCRPPRPRWRSGPRNTTNGVMCSIRTIAASRSFAAGHPPGIERSELVISQVGFGLGVHRRPPIGLHRFRHGNGLGELVPATEVDVGHGDNSPIIDGHQSSAALEVMVVRFHPKHAVARGAASEQLREIILRRSRLKPALHHVPQHPAPPTLRYSAGAGRRYSRAPSKKECCRCDTRRRPRRTSEAEPIPGIEPGVHPVAD